MLYAALNTERSVLQPSSAGFYWGLVPWWPLSSRLSIFLAPLDPGAACESCCLCSVNPGVPLFSAEEWWELSQDPIPSATANLSDGLAGAWSLQVLSCRVCIKWSPIEVEILKKRHVSVFYAPFLEDFRGADRNRGLLF